MNALAVVLGVAFVAGFLVFTGHPGQDLHRTDPKHGPDVTVRPVQTDTAKATGDGTGAVTADMAGFLAALPGVARADGLITDRGTSVIGNNGKVIGGGTAPGLAGKPTRDQ